MTRTRKIRTAVVGIVLAAGIGVGATACDKASEPFKDSGRTGTDNSPALVITQPDGFNNAAAKCLGPDLIVTTYHGDSSYGAIAVSKDDPNCAGHPAVKLGK